MSNGLHTFAQDVASVSPLENIGIAGGGIGRRRVMRLAIQLPQAGDDCKAWSVARAEEIRRTLRSYSAPQSGSATSLKNCLQGDIPVHRIKGNPCPAMPIKPLFPSVDAIHPRTPSGAAMHRTGESEG